jgi:protein-S-isoprenylcysteine O-methyltransferase Ste14
MPSARGRVALAQPVAHGLLRRRLPRRIGNDTNRFGFCQHRLHGEDVVELERIAVPLFGPLAGFVCMALPAIRLRSRTQFRRGSRHAPRAVGIRRMPATVESVLGMAFGLVMAGFTAWMLLFGLLGPESLAVRTAPTWVGACGWFVMAAGLLLVAIGQTQMGASWRMGIPNGATPLVTQGLFGVVRNPIYAATELMFLGMTFVTPSPWPIALCGALAVVVALRARVEEQHLLSLHGEDYRRYAHRVGRFVPGLGKIRSDTRFASKS